MAKARAKPVPSPRKSFMLPICAAVLIAALIVAGSYWYSHRSPTLQSHMQRGDDYGRQDRQSMAMEEYMAAAAINKSDAAPYLAMSRLEEAAGNLGTAADRLGTVLYYHPTFPHIQCRRAQLYGMANRYETAFRVACDAVKIEPNCAAAHNGLGMLLDHADDVQGAARELGKAHELSPDDEALTLDYARVLAKSGKPDDALNIVESVIPVTKKFKVPANYLEGWILAEFGRGGHPDYNKADMFLGAALAENHNHTASLAESGKIFLRRHLNVAAEDQLDRAHKMGPDTIDLLDDLVLVYRANHSPKLDQASAIDTQMRQMLVPLKSYRRQWIQHPDDIKNKIDLARAEMGASNILDAFQLVKEVLEKDPKSAGANKLYNEMKNPSAPNRFDR